LTVLTGILIAILELMCFTPIGTIKFPMISITIAHIPILVATLVLGFNRGFILALIFGLTSMFIAMQQGTGFDSFFINPCVSVLPRLLIPITTKFIFDILNNLLISSQKKINKKKIYFITACSIAIGNLTNTFGVYIAIYLIYFKKIKELTGQSAFNLIFGLISTVTIWKCLLIIIITTPIVLVLKEKEY
jgi:uncharacterized membrane protein